MADQTLGGGRTTTAEAFWYVLGCIWFGAYYFAKVPVKRALSDYGLAEPTGAEKFWYVVMNIALGSGYLAKTIAKKALSEVRFDGVSGQAMIAPGQHPQVTAGPVGPNTERRPRVEGAEPNAQPPGESAS